MHVREGTCPWAFIPSSDDMENPFLSAVLPLHEDIFTWLDEAFVLLATIFHLFRCSEVFPGHGSISV